MQNAVKTGGRGLPCVRASRRAARPRPILPGASPLQFGADSYEADLSAEEAQASPDAWVQGAKPDAIRPSNPETAATEGPQETHPVALASPRRSDARRRRLSKSGDFDRVYREGNSRANRFLVLYSFPRGEGEPDAPSRLGLSVGRKLGGAVARNKVKRAVRQAFWDLDNRLQPGHDYVVVARPDAEGLLERDGQEGIRSSLAELVEASGQERLT